MDTKTFTAVDAHRLAQSPVNRCGTDFPVAAMVMGQLDQASVTYKLQTLPNGPELWRLYQQQSSVSAENALVECYLPLVGSILNRLAGTLPGEVDREDLYSAGLLGLLTALRKFNPATGVPFDSYARQRIRGAMFDEIRRMDWVPRSIRAKAKQFQNTFSQLEQELGRLPTKSEAAKAMDLTAAEYDELMQEIRPAQFIRLDAAGENETEGDSSFGEAFAQPDEINPFDLAATSELKDIVFEKLKHMPQIQRQVLTLYYLEGLYLHEIATALKLTEGRISQIQAQAIQNLRGYLKRYENGIADNAPAMPLTRPVKNGKRTVRVQDKTRGTHSKINPLAVNIA